MNKNSEKKKRIWPFVWIVIFLSFIILDLGFKIFFSDEKIIYNFVIGGRAVKLSVLENGIFIGVKVLKLIGISLNFIYSVINNRKDYSLNIALILTLLADTFLAVNPSSTLAVLVFCFVQYFHSVRFSDNKIFNLVRAALMIVLLSVGYFVNIANIYAFAFVYMLLIVGNILFRDCGLVAQHHGSEDGKQGEEDRDQRQKRTVPDHQHQRANKGEGDLDDVLQHPDVVLFDGVRIVGQR